MTTVELLHTVANDPEGAVIAMDDRRAQRLVRTGYARIVAPSLPPKKKEKA